MNDSYGTGFFGGGEFLAFLIFAIIFGGGWGGYGFGGRGMSGAGAVIADTGIQSQLSQIQSQINTNRIEDTLGTLQATGTQGFAGLNTAVTNGFANTVNTVNQGFAAVNHNLCQGFAALTNSTNQGFAAQALQSSQNTQSIINAICGLSSKIDANTIAELSANNAALKAEVSNAHQTAVLTKQNYDLAAQLAACCCKITNMTAAV